MTYKITPDPEGTKELLIDLDIDLREYLDISRRLYQRKEQLDDAKHFKEVQDKLITEIPLQPFLATELWHEIKEKLIPLCNTKETNEQLLANELSKKFDMSVVFRIIATHFSELFKNSLDAKITTFLEGKSDDSTLKIRIFIPRPINIHDLRVIITDNGGGFKDSYIEKFNLHDETYELDHAQKQDGILKDFVFGGQGLGLRQCDKEICSAGGSMRIENVTNDDQPIGARLTFSSSLLHAPKENVAPCRTTSSIFHHPAALPRFDLKPAPPVKDKQSSSSKAPPSPP